MTTTGLDGASTARVAVLCAAQFMLILDFVIVNVALPAIRTDLHLARLLLGISRSDAAASAGVPEMPAHSRDPREDNGAVRTLGASGDRVFPVEVPPPPAA